MSDQKKEIEVKNELKLEIPNQLPEGFPPVEPHVNHRSNKFTILLTNGNTYAITSDAKHPQDVLERIFCTTDAPNAVCRKTVPRPKTLDNGEQIIVESVYFMFPEAVVLIASDTLEGIEAGWPPVDLIEDEGEDEDEDEDEEPKPRKKPKKPW